MMPFNKPYFTGKETDYIKQSVDSGKISGNGMFTQKCHFFFEKKYNLKKCLLTTSCTDALEMAAILANIKEGDEIIIPSFTFVSTALAFIRQGAKIVFADSYKNHPNIDANKIEVLITPKTKAIVVVHYAGVACDMDKIMQLASVYDLFVIEDAAQAIDSFYIGNDGVKKPLGSLGHFGCFSFHETKNIQAGEGGLLAINDSRFFKRSEIIWEKGTNRVEFFRGEVNKYSWIDIGSSFLPSDIIAAFLYAQLENLEDIQTRRKKIWTHYFLGLKHLENQGLIKLPFIPKYATNNAHLFYIICKSFEERSGLISYLKDNQITAIFHYLSLHKSEYYKNKHDGRELPNSDKFSDCLVRLPMFYELKEEQIDIIIELIYAFYEKNT